jgi:hypothetical protein
MLQLLMNDIHRLQGAAFEILWQQCAASFLTLYTHARSATPASAARLRVFFSDEPARASIPAIWVELNRAFGDSPEFNTIKQCWDKAMASDDPVHGLFFGPCGRIMRAWRAAMHGESGAFAPENQPGLLVERVRESVGTLQKVATVSLRVHARRYNDLISEQTRALFP